MPSVYQRKIGGWTRPSVALWCTLTLLGCSGVNASTNTSPEPTGDTVNTQNTPGEQAPPPVEDVAVSATEAVPAPMTESIEEPQVVHAILAGPYPADETCGSCATGIKVVIDGYWRDFVAPEALHASTMRCLTTMQPVEGTARFITGPGTCGEGQCRRLTLERLDAECAAPSDAIVTFGEGGYAQCLGTTREAATCRRLGAECNLAARVQHPCANSGVRCTADRERAHGPASRPCECSCSEAYRAWVEANAARSRREGPRP